MSKKISLLMAVHNHQPVGNFGWVFNEAYKMSYLPFVEVLERHPKIKMALHFTGPLLDWIVENQPDFIKRIKKLVKTGQLEILTSGYYEPILPMIPDRDKIGQIQMMSNFVKDELGYSPKGLWVAERVWEPCMPKPLSEAGVEYAIVDDSHFKYAGLDPEQVFGYYVTEEEGKKLFIYPGSEKLRYLLPFRLVDESIDYLRSIAVDGERAVMYADDGEKFGLWPGTHKWVYQEGWLEKFFSALEDNSDWIDITTPGEYIQKAMPTGRIYLPCASYKEMLEWSGGFFRNFLVKYPESNSMHKKMLYVSDKLNSLTKGDKKLEQARQQLYMAQCNCSYWHGVFGGLYLNHLRGAVYNHLIEAEKIIDDVMHKGQWQQTDVIDIDKDGSDEVLINSKSLNLYIDPADGGSVFEIDYKPKSLNLTNTLTRRKETYHARALEKLAKSGKADNSQGPESIHNLAGLKEGNLDKFLNYDWYTRACLLDHFFGDGATLENFAACKYEEVGDFVNQPYAFKVHEGKKENSVELLRNGNLYLKNGKFPVVVKKIISHDVASPGFKVDYEIQNKAPVGIPIWFGFEFNFSVKDAQYNKEGEIHGVNKIEIDDNWSGTKLLLNVDKQAMVWHFPVETVSGSETGLERTYQCAAFLFHWKFKLEPETKWKVSFNVMVKQ